MKSLRYALLATTFGLFFSGSAGAAEYLHVNGRNANWRDTVLSFLREHKPHPDNVSAGFSGDFDLHVYAVKGVYSGTYKLQHVQHPHGSAHGLISALLDGHTGKILGFSGNDVHILTFDRP